MMDRNTPNILYVSSSTTQLSPVAVPTGINITGITLRDADGISHSGTCTINANDSEGFIIWSGTHELVDSVTSISSRMIS